MPGSNARALDKGRSVAADVLILDLEDAVSVEAKEMARAAVATAVGVHAYGKRVVVASTASGRVDRHRRRRHLQPTPCWSPKDFKPEDIRRRALRRRPGARGRRAVAMIETPLAVLNVAIAAAAASVPACRSALIGTNDLMMETGRRASQAPLAPVLPACRRPRLWHHVDSTFELNQLGRLPPSVSRADFGMDGKTLIHRGGSDRQRVFPNADEVIWAERCRRPFAPGHHARRSRSTARWSSASGA
jgi:citrate lyase subunit beta/citryl-CoA lyase